MSLDPTEDALRLISAAALTQQMGAQSLASSLADAKIQLDNTDVGAGFTTDGFRIRVGTKQRLEALKTRLEALR